ncbi:hypothetical protein AC579_7600 [Pseudocercospora musae]|uniref:N-acetyltransferase domain-containing protein n=1 Tax=Pseudocercospora musae TaxID=113226 RepID=A0A139H1C2_9PEZI|nr:hypothetical protein AC579_7600 [Pseudocercospora musae]
MTSVDPKEATHGPLVPDPRPAPLPDLSKPLMGRYVTLEGLRQTHMPILWQNLDVEQNPELLDYLPWDVFADAEAFGAELQRLIKDRYFHIYAVKADPDRLNPDAISEPRSHDETVGIIAYIDPHPAWREVEVGCVLFSKSLQRTAAATEAHYLILKNAMHMVDPPYRRVSWKCNSLNKKSRRAAERLGYVYEGRFRKHMIAQGRSRDSDWLSIIDDEWPVVESALEAWLAKENFNEQGQQVQDLDSIRATLQKRQ